MLVVVSVIDDAAGRSSGIKGAEAEYRGWKGDLQTDDKSVVLVLR